MLVTIPTGREATGGVQSFAGIGSLRELLLGCSIELGDFGVVKKRTAIEEYDMVVSKGLLVGRSRLCGMAYVDCFK